MAAFMLERLSENSVAVWSEAGCLSSPSLGLRDVKSPRELPVPSIHCRANETQKQAGEKWKPFPSCLRTSALPLEGVSHV